MSLREVERERVLAVLRERGVCEDLDELLRSKKLGAATILSLIQILPTVRDDWIKEMLVRILTTREAKGVADHALIREFLSIANDNSLKWAIGNALSVVGTDAVFEDLAKIAIATAHGKAREMVVVALGNMKNPHAPDILVGLLDDESMTGYAAMALTKLKYRPALTKLHSLRSHPQRWVRSKVQRAVTVLEKV